MFGNHTRYRSVALNRLDGAAPVREPMVLDGAIRIASFDTQYAGAREYAPFPGRAMVRPIALLLCVVFALQSRAGAAATPITGEVPALSRASVELHLERSRSLDVSRIQR